MSATKPRCLAVFLDVAKPAFRRILSGIVSYASRRSWNIYIHEQSDRPLASRLTQHWDGIITRFEDPRRAEALRLKLPLVGVGDGFGGDEAGTMVPYVVTDHVAVVRMAVEHLQERGFRDQAFCGFAPTPHNQWLRDRAAAFQDLFARQDRECWIHETCNPTLDNWGEVQRDLAAWLQTLPRPIGLMACNDARACQVLEACRTIGARVPEDIAVIGVDNEESICKFTDPPLTSVDQGSQRIGYQAAALLDRLMAGQQVPCGRHTVEPVDVVTRTSTEILAVADAEVAAALRFIRDHACDPIGLTDVLAATGAASSTLRRRFTAALGRTIADEIRRLRIERAKALLRSTDWPLKQIARQAGFSSAQHLATVLRKYTGLAPKDVRRRAQ